MNKCESCKYCFDVLCMHPPLTNYKNKPNIFKPSNCYKHHFKYYEQGKYEDYIKEIKENE